MTLDEAINVLNGVKAGKTIQCQEKHGTKWFDVSNKTEVNFNFGYYTYRVKPEPEIVYLVKSLLNTQHFMSCPLPSDTILKTFVERVE